MRVANSAPELVDIRGRDSMRAPLLLGVVLFGWVSLALATIPVTRSRAHVGAWSILLVVSVALVSFGWPRRRRVRLQRGASTVEVDGLARNLSDARLRLASIHREWSAGPNEYGVVFEWSSGAHSVLLSGSEPDAVLRDLELVRRVLPLTTLAGWRLPQGSPWTRSPDRSEPPSAESAVEPRLRARGLSPTPSGRTKKSVAGTMLVGSAGVTAIVVMNLLHRIALGDSPAALSLVLPVVSVSLVVAIAIGIGTSRSSIEVGSELVVTRLLYGIPIARRSIARSALRIGYLVGPSGRAPRHVLFDTAEGPIAFRCNPDEGRRVLDALYGGGPSTSSAPPTQRRK